MKNDLKMNMKTTYYILIFLFPSLVMAQKEADDVKSGNRLYNKQKYTEAEIAYRKAIVKNNQSFIANYNLGNSLYKQGKIDEAIKQYQAALPMAGNDKKKLAAEMHNMGNALLSMKKIKESIDAYKLALKNNPKDNETRYNLAYAMALLKDQQKDQNKNNDNKNKNDKNKNKDNQNQENQQKDKDKKQQQPQPQQPQMSKENAQQILDALQQDEKDTKEKADQARSKSFKKAEKDW